MAQKNYTKTEAGQNHAAAFFRVAMLFRLRAVLNSLIDTMDQHFQDLLLSYDPQEHDVRYG